MEYLVLIAASIVILLVRRQVVYWKTIMILGFHTETPIHYMYHPRRYSVVSWLTIFVAVAIASFFTEFALWLRTALFLLAILGGELAGQLRATETYRSILREMLEYPDRDAEDKEQILHDLAKSSFQLLREKRKAYRMMSGKF